MTDELELELDSEQSSEEIINRKDKRLKKLADDVKETNEKLAKEAEARKKAEEDLVNTSKEREFYKGFNPLTQKYPGAGEFQDKIWEKVKSGYDVEDATISILAKEGKYNAPAPKVERESAAGGSAATAMKGNDSKTPQEMTQDERRAQLLDLESKGEFHL